MNLHFREGTLNDIPAIMKLYQKVAAIEGGIARNNDEVTQEYITNFVSKSLQSGLIIVCEHPENPEELIAEIHAYKSGVAVFNHVLGNLTVVVHPEHWSRKIGRTIFTIFLNEVAVHRPDVCKVELISRESNARAIALYQSLGFRIEGRLEMRIRTSERTYEADIPMGWQNPNYEF